MEKHHKIPTTLLLQKSTNRLLLVFTDKKNTALNMKIIFS